MSLLLLNVNKVHYTQKKRIEFQNPNQHFEPNCLKKTLPVICPLMLRDIKFH